MSSSRRCAAADDSLLLSMHNAVFHHEGRYAANHEAHDEKPISFLRGLRAGRLGLRGYWVVAILLVVAKSGQAQTMERLTFQQAIDRAIMENPTVAQATAGIMRAEAILEQVRSSSLPSLAATFSTSVTNPVRFNTGGTSVTVVPPVQTTTTPTFAVP